MNKSKFDYIFLIIIVLAAILNIFIYLTILPLFIWRINNLILIIFFLISLFKKKTLKEKNKNLTILGLIFAFIFLFSSILIIIKYII
ncbi:hypothetical protein DDA98_14685 [Clostridium perfringens]|uniref:hypothetical protein n=1 Tax=Clostridium perfringens TaxID=1502 RepID=UPI000D524468|nr:hypothetical protein [Clostridium perfringens]PVE14364.1 hypothetical protein DDA98_14685 [Clostridium perfringens]